VVDLVEGVAVCGGDEGGWSAEGHEVEGQPRKRRDRRMLGAAVLPPLIGQCPGKLRIAVAMGQRESVGVRRPPQIESSPRCAGYDARQEDAPEAADLPAAPGWTTLKATRHPSVAPKTATERPRSAHDDEVHPRRLNAWAMPTESGDGGA
jgi:hypothetical protein